jgi:hypothetical protein
MKGSSSEDVLAPDDVGDERHPEDQSVHGQKDHQKKLQRQSLTSRGKQEYHLSQKRACPEGCVPGATDASMPVGSAFFTRYFTLENLADKFGSARALQHSIPRPRDTLFPANIRSPFLLDQSLLKVPFLIGCTK